ncbi:MAG: signal peptidase I [Acidobacteriaceae bacterium]
MMNEETPQEQTEQRGTEPAGATEELSLREIRQWLRDVVVAVLVAVFVIVFLYQPVKVEGTSMQPGLQNHDRLFVNKFVYDFGKIHRGDIVVFRYPLDPKKSFIKRVIGLPGDRLNIDDGHVYINGKRLHEPYVPLQYRDHTSMMVGVIPPGEYFVMGDHRNVSEDSRDFGPVPRKDIYGEASLVYWPLGYLGMAH